jgi:hypothetical protein
MLLGAMNRGSFGGFFLIARAIIPELPRLGNLQNRSHVDFFDASFLEQLLATFGHSVSEVLVIVNEVFVEENSKGGRLVARASSIPDTKLSFSASALRMLCDPLDELDVATFWRWLGKTQSIDFIWLVPVLPTKG